MHLTINGWMQGLQQASQISFLPFFQNLIHLEICAAHYVVTDAGAIVRLLHRTPLLQTLTIDMVKLIHFASVDDVLFICI